MNLQKLKTDLEKDPKKRKRSTKFKNWIMWFKILWMFFVINYSNRNATLKEPFTCKYNNISPVEINEVIAALALLAPANITYEIILFT